MPQPLRRNAMARDMTSTRATENETRRARRPPNDGKSRVVGAPKRVESMRLITLDMGVSYLETADVVGCEGET